MSYVEKVTGYEPDQLQGGSEFAVRLYNVTVGEDAEISRGDLLCSSTLDGEFKKVSAAADALKILAIAAVDFKAEATHKVTQAYVSGVFNREKINVGELDIADFEQELRKQNIHLTSMKD